MSKSFLTIKKILVNNCVYYGMNKTQEVISDSIIGHIKSIIEVLDGCELEDWAEDEILDSLYQISLAVIQIAGASNES